MCQLENGPHLPGDQTRGLLDGRKYLKYVCIVEAIRIMSGHIRTLGMSAFQNILASYIPLNLCIEIIGLERDTINQVTWG